VQEALTNCARHAKARNVLVAVHSSGDFVSVVVQDDGLGFNSSKKSQGGLGLIGMKERVQAIDGVVTISSQQNRGTTVRVEIPLGVTA